MIVKTTPIKCPQEELFAFHLDSNNIKKITPQNIHVTLLNKDTTTYEGKVVKLKTKKFFITTMWEVKIEKLEKPNTLVDVALKSPFTYWRHEHIFIKTKEGCELKDVIEFTLPFGILGKIIKPFIHNDIKKMFDYRHKKTKEILEKSSRL